MSVKKRYNAYMTCHSIEWQITFITFVTLLSDKLCRDASIVSQKRKEKRFQLGPEIPSSKKNWSDSLQQFYYMFIIPLEFNIQYVFTPFQQSFVTWFQAVLRYMLQFCTWGATLLLMLLFCGYVQGYCYFKTYLQANDIEQISILNLTVK